MIRLDDITDAAWQIVATRVPAGAVDVWQWRMSPDDVALFQAARGIGCPFIVVQRRERDGGMSLIARRIPSARAVRAGRGGGGA